MLPLATVAADDESLRWCRSLALRAGASVVLAVDARDGAGLAERAAAFRSRDPRVVLVIGREGHDAGPLAAVVEATRVASVGADDAPRVVAAGSREMLSQVHEAVAGLAWERAMSPREDEGAGLVRRLRDLRGDEAGRLDRLERVALDADADDVLACEIDDDGVRAAFASRGTAVGAELPVGVGPSADALVRRAGARAVRRWLVGEVVPEVTLLRDRIANLSRFVVGAPRALELAIAREALRELIAAVRRDIGIAGIEHPHVVLLGGAFAQFAPAEAVAAFLDAAEPHGLARLQLGDSDAALVVVPANADRGRPLRIVDERGERPIHPAAGALSVIPTAGRAVVHAERDEVVAGSPALGVVIDARGRPLAIPDRDGERQTLLRKWAASWP